MVATPEPDVPSAVVRELAQLEDRPLRDQVAVFEAAYASLSESLDATSQ